MHFRTLLHTMLFALGFMLIPLIYVQAQSILQTNDCYQISVIEDGIYKITYDDIKSWGLNAESISIYGNGAGELPLINGTELPDTLHEIGIYINKGSDNIFNSGDYILFYGQSPNTWSYNKKAGTFEHNTHSYELKNYYYVTSRPATKEIQTAAKPTESPTITVTSYDNLQAYENNETYAFNSGRNRFESISGGKTITFSAPSLITGEEAEVEVSFAARHSSAATASIRANGANIGTMSYSATTTNKPYAYLKTSTFLFKPTDNTITITVTPNYSGASSRGYLDYCILHTRCALQTNTEQLRFRDKKSIGKDAVATFSISSPTQCSVWNISNPDLPINMPVSFSGGKTSYTASASELEEYIAFSNSYKNVSFEKKMTKQNILLSVDADMVIIANDIFSEYAQKLAQFHEANDNMKVTCVTQEAICNEFSAGRKDVTALRNYLRYIYKKGNKKLKYVLLFGDGIYTNDIELNGPKLFTYETKESLNEDYSLCTDDYFGILDDNCGASTSDNFIGDLSIAVGRIPANTKKEAEIVINKIINYATNTEFRGDWQNQLCFLADDANENQTIHMSDADQLCTMIETNHPQFNFDKIYADAYKQVRSSAGERYPDVVTAIFERMQKGCLIFNYSGHGNETRMMAEYAIDASSITTWKNKTKLPLFIAAACNITHFDYDGVSLGEQLLLLPNGGSIGMISATRYSYASSNYNLSKNFYNIIFEIDPTTSLPYTIGDALKIAKEKTTGDIYQNRRIYCLLGDPAMRLALPTYSVVIDSINGKPIADFSKNIQALSTISVAGHINDNKSVAADNFNGTLHIKLFDKSQSITTLGNDGNDIFTFDSYSNILFQGLASVEQGKFSFSTIIPEDIYYYDGNGKMSFYATNDSIQAAGYYSDFTINGSDDSDNDDYWGPKISLYINDTLFVSGGTTNENPTLLLLLQDESGINISNASIGHDIVLVIDGDESNQIILNDFYCADLNTYISGTLQYTIQNLEEGEHTLTVTVWDTRNNVSEEDITFVVANSKSITLSQLYNYPNPMTDHTRFHFEHNQAGNEVKIVVRIYSSEGGLVRSITQKRTPDGFIDNAIIWDGTSSQGAQMKSGIYPYTVEIQTAKGEKLYGEQKILLIRDKR